jgi:peptide deformylase
MALLEIRTYPDPVLRKIAKPVDDANAEIIKLAENMVETMRLSRGAGLAANQVGVPLRLIVLEENADKKSRGDKDNKAIVVMNPVIIESEGEEISEEGCLSLPKYYEYIKRAGKVSVKGMTIDKVPFEMQCEGHMARAFQHEIDHLNGVLFIDYLSPVKRNLFKKKYVKKDR